MENYYVDFRAFNDLCYRLLEEIRKSGEAYDAVLCPLRGGFYLSSFMCRHLDLPMIFIEIKSYNGRENGEVQVGIRPDLPVGKYLVCDDIYDRGKTFEAIRALYPSVKLYLACLISKDPDADIYYGSLVDRNVWVDFFWEVM